jgi:phosphoserine aminotransferase
MARVHNFNAGPAVLPVEALEAAQKELLDFNNSGMSILEHSHRGKEYAAVHDEAIANLRALLGIPEEYAVLFLQGGASLQFAMVPMNLLGAGLTADYVNSGAWASKAVKEAKLIGKVNVAADCGKEIPTRVPRESELKLTPGAAYVHITSNETISGAQW